MSFNGVFFHNYFLIFEKLTGIILQSIESLNRKRFFAEFFQSEKCTANTVHEFNSAFWE